MRVSAKGLSWEVRKARSVRGEGGIRTPDRLAPMPHFECGTINHSATSPGANQGKSGPEVGASSRAFSSEVEAGSREENASKQKSRARF